jgi:hypothetical protein
MDVCCVVCCCCVLLLCAAWGGHLELTALSSALQRQIKVHAVGMDTIKLGEWFLSVLDMGSKE